MADTPNIYVSVIWSRIPDLGEAQITNLSTVMPMICANALTVPGSRMDFPKDVVVEVRRQSTMNVNMPPLLVKILAHDSAERSAKKAEIMDKITQDIRAHFQNVPERNILVNLDLGNTFSAWI